MEALYFNVDDGYTEGIVRGYKSGILNSTHYLNLTQCETLDDLKLQLSATDYSNFLANEPSPIATSTIHEKATQKLIDEFKYVRANASEKLSKFLDYLTDTNELLERCHPLGIFDSMPALCVATNTDELYNTVLIETPLAPYFENCISADDLDELNIEIIRNALYKAYLEDFYRYCKEELGGVTGQIMNRRAINITINSFGTELSKDDRVKLLPSFGKLYPAGHERLRKADDVEQVRSAVEAWTEYRSFFDMTLTSFGGEATSEAKTLDDQFFEYEVHLNKLTFQQQFHYAIFYAFLKLKEQEIRNIVWIAEYYNTNNNNNINFIISITKSNYYHQEEQLEMPPQIPESTSVAQNK
nr:7726_t:CDS:2 [Entrophospora candida]